MARQPGTDAEHVIRDHRRQWRDCLYVYPVISRRSKGLSIGVNLNPNKDCTFACIYCQIDRTARRRLTGVDLAILHDELHIAMEEIASGRLWAEARFAGVPHSLRRLNDIAFSGDGEPTCLENFDRAVAAAVKAKADCHRPDVKLVVITNSTHFNSAQFHRALPLLDAGNGEIWAKLDAGTEKYFQRVNRPAPGLKLKKIVDDLAVVAQGRPVVIQTLFARLDGHAPPPAEINAYIARLSHILDSGGAIKLLQVHTIARPPAESVVSALSNTELDALADVIRAALPDLHVETFYGQNVSPQRSQSPGGNPPG